MLLPPKGVRRFRPGFQGVSSTDSGTAGQPRASLSYGLPVSGESSCSPSGTGQWAWCEIFSVAGFSALMVLIAHSSTAYEYFALVAAAPLLAAVGRIGPYDAARLFTTFAVALLGVRELDSICTSPVLYGVRVGGAGLIAAVFGLLFGFARRRFGFNPILLALLWVGFELAVVETGIAPFVLSSNEPSGAFSIGISQVFGFAILSLLIILVNSLVLIAIDRIVSAEGRVSEKRVNERQWNPSFAPGPFADTLFLVPQRRGPPVVFFLPSTII